MTVRIDVTDEAGESAPWAPTSAVVVQTATAEGSKVVVEIHGRSDTTAPWVAVVGSYAAQEPLISCVKLAQIKIVYRGNKVGDPLKVWSDA